MQKQNRTDRILILAALAILLIASGLFYFDGWMWGTRGNRGERIGVLSKRAGDVRMKFEGDLKWQKATPGQDLIYNDSIYAGAGSQADLELGQSDMTVTENTLVVLRRDQDVNFMNLAYGSLFGKIAKNEKVLIDTGDGKPIEFNPTTDSQITLKKVGHKTVLKVKSGTAEITINGKKALVGKDSKVVVEDKAAAPHIEKAVEEAKLEALKPLKGQVLYSEDIAHVDFQWKWNTERRPAADDRFKVEFSTSPMFNSIHAVRDVKGQLGTSVIVADSTSLFYRVRGPNGELSQVEKLNFVRLNKPLIVKPVAQTRFEVPAERDARVEIEFRKPEGASIWYQISSDPQFQTILNNENTSDLKSTRDFAPGQYYLRAKSDFGDGHETGWTEPVPFTVDHKTEKFDLNKAPMQAKVLIPNQNYPAALYSAPPAKVKEYLAKKGLLKDYFPFPREMFDHLNLQYSNSPRTQTQTDVSWPKEKLRPGRYLYKFQTAKGTETSPWSDEKTLDIAMEPPRPVGDVQYGETNPRGESDATWNFTPILYAGSYDVEVSHRPDMVGAQQLHVSDPVARTSLTGENYWRVRARDPQGRIISDYSPIYKMKTGVPVYVAKTQPPPREVSRRPAATERTEMKADRIREEPFVKNGWWTWLGFGENYVDYRQSVPGLSTISDHHLKGPSQFIEAGYLSHTGWGGVLSVKQTPGEINPQFEDASHTIDTTSYSWSTMTAEALYRKISPWSLFGTPVIYGVRLGIQQHKVPFVFIDSVDNAELQTNQITMASAGILAEWSRRRWTYYWLMRYQYPLSSTASGASSFNLTPTFAFDGSVGTSYNITQQLKLGLFWYGQWHQYSFDYIGSDGVTENKGFQSLFYSNVDLRLGWDF